LNLHDSLTGVASHGRILIAEDDDLTLELLATVLRRENYEVVTVTDGREALDQLAKARSIWC